MFSLSTSTKEINKLPNLYPNPSEGLVYIENNNNWEQADIYLSNGQLVSSISIKDEELVIIELPQELGLYMIQLKNKRHQSEISKILKI